MKIGMFDGPSETMTNTFADIDESQIEIDGETDPRIEHIFGI